MKLRYSKKWPDSRRDKRCDLRRPKTGHSCGLFTLGRLLGSGGTRWTFACKEDPEIVIKVPRPGHYWANHSGAKNYKSSSNRKRLAKCSLLRNGWLLMERVKPLHTPIGGRVRGARVPAWADEFDSYQVGRARDGRIVAFDYA